MIRFLRGLVALGCLAALAGCTRTAPAPGGLWRTMAEEEVLLHVVWQTDLSTRNAFALHDTERGGVAASGGLVAVGSSARGLFGLNASDGAIRWENGDPAEAYAAPPRFAGSTLLVPGPDGTLRGLAASSGVSRWERAFDAPLHATPTVDGDHACVTDAFGNGAVVDVASGAVSWDFRHEVGGQMTVLGDGACSFDGDSVLVGFSDGTLGAFAEERTEWLVDLSHGATRFVDVDTAPLLWNDLVIAASFGGGVVAINRESGATVWHTDLTGATSPLYVDGAAVTTTADASVVWLDPATGDVRYELALEAETLQAPIRVGDVLVIASPRGLYVVDAHVPWVYHRFDPGSGFTAPAVSDGRYVYALSDSGFVYGLEVRAY